MNTIKLSICIPTYNRARYIRETIDSALNQLTSDQMDMIELVVSDNASTDNTEDIIKGYQKRFKNVVYFKWPENMGADRNYLKVIEIAHGEYCWFLGSDDKVCDNSVAKVLGEIQNSEPDILLFDRAYSDMFLSDRPTMNSWSELPGSYSFHSQFDKIKFHQYLMKCTSIGGLFSFISVIVFKKSLWDAVPDKTRFAGTAYVHTHVLFALLKKGVHFHYIKEPRVICRMGNDSFCPDRTNIDNIYKRWQLDIDGYRDITYYVFGSDSHEYFYIHKMLGNYISLPSYIMMHCALQLVPGRGTDDKVPLLLINNGFFAKYAALRLANRHPLRFLTLLLYKLLKYAGKTPF